MTGHEHPAERTADLAKDARWLTAAERRAWLGTAALMMRLPAALDAQLQRDAGLSFFEYSILAILSEQPSRTLQMSEIARACSSSLSRLSHTASRLEKQGYLTRSRVAGAGRRTNATLSEAGHAMVVAAAPGHVAKVRELLIDSLSASQLESLELAGARVMERTDPTDPCRGLDPQCWVIC